MPSNQETIDRVRAALAAEPRTDIDHHQLRLAFDDGFLTVEGEVGTIGAKKLALEAAKPIEGARAIIDRLRVKPGIRLADEAVLERVCDALLAEPLLAGCIIRRRGKAGIELVREVPLGALGTVDAEAEAGVVNLDGQVPGLLAKRMAGVRAWWVPGTRDVVNAMDVDPAEEDSAAKITEAVRLALETDPRLDATRINIDVRGTTVTLSGDASSKTQAERAELVTWSIFGVDKVVNQISVLPEEAGALVVFPDRAAAGRLLGRLLREYGREGPIVLALPRGGVPVGYEVARALGAALDVLVVRKLGAPLQPELGLGAVAEGGATFVDRKLCDEVGVSQQTLSDLIAREAAEVERRVRRYRRDRPAPELRGRSVIVVDDGIATGGTARAAIRAVRRQGARKVIFATPVAARDTAAELAREVDRLVCIETPVQLWAIGAWYEDFQQVSDDEVLAIFERAQEELSRLAGPSRKGMDVSLKRYMKEVAAVSPRTTVADACREMVQRNIGDVVVISDDNKPIGLLTDRDVIVRVLVEGKLADKTMVGDVMTPAVATLNAGATLEEVTELMRDRKIRRVPIVDQDQRLIGLVAFDDLVLLLGMEFGNLAGSVAPVVASAGRPSEKAAPPPIEPKA